MTAPVGIPADVGYSRNAVETIWTDETEELFPHRCQIYQLTALSCVLLCNLEFHHLGCVMQLVEDRRVRFAWLEVERSILGLQRHIVGKLSVERFKLAHGLHHTVFILVISTIDERTPDNDAPIRFECTCEHVGTLCVRTVIISRPRLLLRIGFDQETAEIRYQLIDFCGLLVPPVLYLRVERIGSMQLMQSLGTTEVGREIHSYAVRTEPTGYLGHFLQILMSENLR